MKVGLVGKFIAGYCRGEVMLELEEKEKQKWALPNRVESAHLNPSGHPKFQASSSRLVTPEYGAVTNDPCLFRSCRSSNILLTEYSCSLYDDCSYGDDVAV